MARDVEQEARYKVLVLEAFDAAATVSLTREETAELDAAA
jgi:hypothetical protein